MRSCLTKQELTIHVPALDTVSSSYPLLLVILSYRSCMALEELYIYIYIYVIVLKIAFLQHGSYEQAVICLSFFPLFFLVFQGKRDGDESGAVIGQGKIRVGQVSKDVCHKKIKGPTTLPPIKTVLGTNGA